MEAAITTERVGKDANLVKVQVPQFGRWNRRPVKADHAVRRVDADDQLRFEALQEIGVRLNAVDLATAVQSNR